MSILVPVVSTGITFTEIPDHITYFIELGNCSNHCPNCHSPYLSDTVLSPPDLADVERMAERAAERGADAIVLMGGTTNGISDDDLVTICRVLGTILPVGLYSGRDDEERDKDIARRSNLHWLKTGSYKAELGGLTSPTTNQRFYHIDYRYAKDHSGVYIDTEAVFTDLTYLFQKGAT